MEALVMNLAEQIPIVLILVYWLQAERKERYEERTYYRNREEVWFGLVAQFIKQKMDDQEEIHTNSSLPTK